MMNVYVYKPDFPRNSGKFQEAMKSKQELETNVQPVTEIVASLWSLACIHKRGAWPLGQKRKEGFNTNKHQLELRPKYTEGHTNMKRCLGGVFRPTMEKSRKLVSLCQAL